MRKYLLLCMNMKVMYTLNLTMPQSGSKLLESPARTLAESCLGTDVQDVTIQGSLLSSLELF